MQVADKNRETRSTVVLALICGVAQLALAPNVGIGNGRANFALIFSACLSLLVGGRRAVVAGFLSGLFFDLSTTGPVGLMAFCLTVSSYVLGLEERNRMSGDLAVTLTLFTGADLLVSLVYHLAMLLVGQADSLLDVVVFRTLPTALLSLLLFLPFAYYFCRVHVTGPNLGGGHLGKRGF